jgi:hypothetical protein
MRDATGKLSMYATGQVGNGDGIYVWGFNETNQTWSQVFQDGSSGFGLGVWGSASNDVYVVGYLISGSTNTGRVYHFNGTSWLQVTNVGTIAIARGVAGTAADDVWVSLADGTILHFAPVIPPSLGISLIGTSNVSITWPSTVASYRLQATAGLTPSVNWATVTNAPLLNSNQYQLVLPMTNGNQFFRLIYP